MALADGTVCFPLTEIASGYGAVLRFTPAPLPELHICLRYLNRQTFEMQEATLSVVTVNTVQPTFVQLNTFARVTISTFGSQPRDVVKFVPSAAECESAAYAEYLLGNQQVVNVLFTDASIEKYYLCYKPVDEAFTFLEVFSLTVRDDRNLIDFASTKAPLQRGGRDGGVRDHGGQRGGGRPRDVVGGRLRELRGGHNGDGGARPQVHDDVR